VTRDNGTASTLSNGHLPRRTPATAFNGDVLATDPYRLDLAAQLGMCPGLQADPAAYTELAGLRERVPGVRGCVIASTDGMLVIHDLGAGPEPYDLAALASSAFGVGRQCGFALGQGPFHESTIRSHNGYFTVYAVGKVALLAVLGDDGLNVARLHLEARPVAERLVDLLRVGTT
jgi:predicted regulator of Ras-like GTPase activity (Roadblock/LC7/MglB family)